MLSCTKLMELINSGLCSIKDTNSSRKQIALTDCLLSAYALFNLKYPSLLRFDTDAREEHIENNIKKIYGIQAIPSDTQMRERLDLLPVDALRKLYRRLFSQCQRSNRLKLFEYYDGHYLMPLDGTGYFSSSSVHCDNCCQKNHRDGRVTYYHQMLCGSIVHPNQKVVLPFAPEPIVKSDGTKKNDCERRAAERFLEHLSKEHPHLKLIITGDSLYSNGPFIERLKARNHHFILVAKEGDHKHLFEEFRLLAADEFEIKEEKITHQFKWMNHVTLNASRLDCQVNVLEYREIRANGKSHTWTWVTDIELSEKNIYQIMRGGRARHKIENETFNTLKNQGYQFEHNFGHGNKNLSTIFAQVMVLAFFVDQLMQLGCKRFTKALAKLKTKASLWDRQRSFFFSFFINSFDDLWNALAFGHRATLNPDTS